MTTTATQWRAAWQMPGGLPQSAEENWSYTLDDPGSISAGEGGWPFRTTFAWFTEPQPCLVRLSPDIAQYAWQTEYVIVSPDGTEGFSTAGFYVVGRDGTSVRVSVALRLQETGWEAQLPDIEGDTEVMAEKASRVCAFLNKAARQRDNGEPFPNTFHGIPQPAKEDSDASHEDRT